MKPGGWLVAGLVPVIAPLLASAGAVIALGACASCQSTVRVATMPVIAAGTFDGAVVDPGRHRLYLSDRTDKGLDVVDISSTTPRFVGTEVLGDIPNGLAIAPDQGRLYAGLEGGGMAVIDTHSMHIVDMIHISGGGGVDLLDYSPKTHRVYAGTGDLGEIVSIDTSTDQADQRMLAGAPIEQPRYDPADGKVYVTAPKTSSVLQMDPTTGYITRRYFVPKCGPKGLAINPGSQIAMLACGSSIGLLNLATGEHSVSRSVQGGDIVSYDTTADRFVVASPHGASDSAVGVFTGKGDLVGSVPASPKAHAAVLDGAHGLVYAPGNAGLMSFSPGACAPAPAWLSDAGGFALFAVPFIGLVLFLVLYARRMGRPRGGPPRRTSRELQDEDLAAERERMKALEDGIFGLEP